jgi:GMP synthase-like glutamine amidotransferase
LAAIKKATVTTARFFEPAALPERSKFDVLVALGGPMSVNDEARLPWLIDEKHALSGSPSSLGEPVLGICLGAQLMASSLSRVLKFSPSPSVSNRLEKIDAEKIRPEPL